MSKDKQEVTVKDSSAPKLVGAAKPTTAFAKAVGSASEVATKPVETRAKVVEEPRYKMNLYKPNGILRSEIPRQVYANMSAKYGDIMRAVPSYKFATMDEIVEIYWELERRLKFDMGRTRPKIAAAVEEMVAADLVRQK